MPSMSGVVVINPSMPGAPASLAIGILQEHRSQAADVSATPGEGALPGASEPSPPSPARAALQAAVPPVRSQRRLAAASSLIATGTTMTGAGGALFAIGVQRAIYAHDYGKELPGILGPLLSGACLSTSGIVTTLVGLKKTGWMDQYLASTPPPAPAAQAEPHEPIEMIEIVIPANIIDGSEASPPARDNAPTSPRDSGTPA